MFQNAGLYPVPDELDSGSIRSSSDRDPEVNKFQSFLASLAEVVEGCCRHADEHRWLNADLLVAQNIVTGTFNKVKVLVHGLMLVQA